MAVRRAARHIGPNTVWLVHEADPAIIGPVMSDPDVVAKMQAAGIVGEPQVWVS